MTISWLVPEIAQRFAGTLLQFIWQGAVIAFLTAICLRLLRRHSAEARYAAGVAGLALMLLAPVVTFAFYAQTGAVALMLLRASHMISRSGLSSALASEMAAWTQGILIVWCTGVSAFIIRLATGWYLSRRLVRSADGIVPDGIQQMFDHLKERLALTGIVRLLVHARIDSPMVVGWLRPVVLLPLSAITSLSEDHLRAVFAHELAHIRRNDFLVNMLQRCVEAILFYHPAVWWLSNRIRVERENCCDDRAVSLCGNRKLYAEALVRLERERETVPALAVAATGSGTIRRVQRILGLEPSGADWQSVVVALLFVLVWISTGVLQPTPLHAQQLTPRSSIGSPTVPAVMSAKITSITSAPVSSPLGAIAAIVTAQPEQVAETQAIQVEQGTPGLEDRLDIDVKNVSLRTLLSNLAMNAGLNLSMSPDLETKVTVNLGRITVADAFDAILTPLNLKYEIKGKILFLTERPVQRIFNFDYVNAQRSATSASSNQASDMMQDLEKLLGNIVTGPGSTFYLDKMTGIVVVTAEPSKMALLDMYQKMMNRKVVITARFIEVQLNDPAQQGINWSAVTGNVGVITSSLAQSSAFQVTLAHKNFSTVIENLRAQGKVDVISSPQVQALNHQPAVIRDGAQGVSFQTTTQVDPQTGAFIQAEEGVVLYVTPAISDGITGLDIRATATERTGTATSPKGDTTPLTNVRETNTIVRVPDGDTVILSGLASSTAPDLTSLPLIGRFFRNKTLRTNIVILLTTETVSGK